MAHWHIRPQSDDEQGINKLRPNFRSPKNAVKLIGKTYFSTHLKHFSKHEAVISELRAVFESLHAWFKRAQYWPIWTKHLGITAKEPDCYQSNLSVFLVKIWIILHLILILYSFPYKMRPWLLKFYPQKSKNRSLPPPPTDHSWVGEII